MKNIYDVLTQYLEEKFFINFVDDKMYGAVDDNKEWISRKNPVDITTFIKGVLSYKNPQKKSRFSLIKRLNEIRKDPDYKTKYGLDDTYQWNLIIDIDDDTGEIKSEKLSPDRMLEEIIGNFYLQNKNKTDNYDQIKKYVFDQVNNFLGFQANNNKDLQTQIIDTINEFIKEDMNNKSRFESAQRKLKIADINKKNAMR